MYQIFFIPCFKSFRAFLFFERTEISNHALTVKFHLTNSVYRASGKKFKPFIIMKGQGTRGLNKKLRERTNAKILFNPKGKKFALKYMNV